MSYQGGSNLFLDTFNELKSKGAAIDIYSSSWLEKNIGLSFDESSIDEVDLETGGTCRGHLLIIATDLAKATCENMLPKIHAPFELVYGKNAAFHKPDFIFINLASKKILCAGLGRKNSFFCYDLADKIVFLDARGIMNYFNDWFEEDINFGSGPFKSSLNYIKKFTKYDFLLAVDKLLTNLYEFGEEATRLDNFPLNSGLISELIELGPNTNGLYDIDGELMTLDQSNTIILKYDECDKSGNEKLEILKLYFPDLSWVDLNTQDY